MQWAMHLLTSRGECKALGGQGAEMSGGLKGMLLAGAVALAAACTAPAGGGSVPTSTTLPANPESPVIASFSADGSGGPAPVAAALRWSISDPVGLDMDC